MKKKKKKRIKPSQKERKRYLVVVIDRKKTFEKLRKRVKDFCNIDARFIRCNEKKSKVMICVPRKCLNDAKASLMFSGFNCIGISGTIKRARMKWMKK